MIIPKPYDAVAAAITAMYIVQAVNSVAFGGRLSQLGIVPRRWRSLVGVLTAPMLHGGFGHLIANTAPLAIVACAVLSKSAAAFVAVTLMGIVCGGLATWLLARRSVHMGSSGLVYSYFGYLLFSAWFDKTYVMLFLVAWLGLGRLMRGLLPQGRGVSFEGHVLGFAAGVATAWSAAWWGSNGTIREAGRILAHSCLRVGQMVAMCTIATAALLCMADWLRGGTPDEPG